MSLETILKEIKEVKPFADADAEAGPIETLAGRRGRKMQSMERMKLLKRDYIRELMLTSQYVVITGSSRDKLAEELTSGKMGLFSADPEEFYKDLSSRVNPALYQGKSTVADLFDVLGRHLEDKANELDIVEYPQIIFKERYVQHIGNPEQFTDLVRVAVNEQMGAEVVGIQAVNSIVDKAIEKGHVSKSTSIVLNVSNPQLALDILRDFKRLSNHVYLVVAGEAPKGLETVTPDATVSEVNKSSVKHVIETLKSKRN